MTILKFLIFGILIVWALVDAVISAREAPSFFIGAMLFLGSLVLNGLFILLLAVIWSWVAGRFRRTKEIR